MQMSGYELGISGVGRAPSTT